MFQERSEMICDLFLIVVETELYNRKFEGIFRHNGYPATTQTKYISMIMILKSFRILDMH